ncbi:Protein ripply3 [Microtus ochrogaster]|uniref:Protein ripply3 n=1 Tax=Microtus ochrogaster TaxID=79684 RepID=A0A8J6GPK1_MICOH|nr:Protein ripply3 [Microtus ochrogaster]
MRPEAAAGAREALGSFCHCPGDDPGRPPVPRGPERLYLPLSKRQEYLQSSGEKVLASFPVQATIHFYNDESESDSEEEQEEEAQPKCLQSQEAARQGSGPGGKGRVGLAGL